MRRVHVQSKAAIITLGLLAALCCAHVEAQGEVGYIDGLVVNTPGRQPPDSNGRIDKPLAGTTVTLADGADGHVVETTVTDAKGEFHFAAPPGDYSVSTARDSRRVHVDANRRIWVRLGTPGNM